MRWLSLRGWLLLVSVLFAVLVVGGIALTTYFIVTDGMQAVVSQTSERVAASSETILGETADQAEAELRGAILSNDARRAKAKQELARVLPGHLERGGLASAGFALYDERGDLVWRSSSGDGGASQSDVRRETLRTQAASRSFGQRANILQGLVTHAQLAEVVEHRPVALPFGERGVLDVTYVPTTEEHVIDAIRLPMTALAIAAMIIMVVLMQTSMAWVLNLVNDLRKAADSIDAGRLDERLPASAQNEIGELARSLNRLIERLQRRSEAQARFVADASHELATPVAGIRGYTNILRAWGGEDPTVREESIDAIDRESRRMARLTSDLLNLLHADQGLRLRKERFDVNVQARERLAATASRYLDKDIEFIGPEDESLVIVGDPERMEDVLSILLDNAGKYTPAGGTVRVTTTRRRELVTIKVSDTGAGIPKEDLPRVFDRFYRSDEARAQGEGGFGLGLAIAKGIVESMNGTISAESEVGRGTTFTVVVPRGRL